MQGIHKPILLPEFATFPTLQSNPFALLDVGCSGGIAPGWKNFLPALKVLGIDIMKGEVERLTQEAEIPDSRYFAYRVGLPEDHPFKIQHLEAGRNIDPSLYVDSSACWGAEVLRKREASSAFASEANNWKDSSLAEELIGIDEFWSSLNQPEINFFKIDIDGPDFESLVSSTSLLKSERLFGLAMEVNYCGGQYPTDHAFCNTDRFLKELGFELMALSIRKYSRKALPGQFEFNCFGSTTFGAPLQGDAIYVKHSVINAELDDLNLFLKVIGVLDLIGLPDCVAKVISNNSRHQSAGLPLKKWLNKLAKSVSGCRIPYPSYLAAFEKNPRQFFASSFNSIKCQAKSQPA